MPPSSVRSAVVQFIQITGASERTAARYLRTYDYNVELAVDAYFSGDAASSSAQKNDLNTLNSLFDGLKKDASDSKDELGLTSTMEYLGTCLGLNIENIELLVALEIVQAPAVGAISRKGYVDGWAAAGIPPSHQEHAKFIKTQTKSLKSNPELFKKVYRYVFVPGREAGQKALDLDTAMIYWDLLFNNPGLQWRTQSHDWLGLWKKFLGEKWTRSVNRDMWNQTLEFATKSMADETLSFWSEDGAWPSVIDDFVDWCWSHGVSKGGDTEMS